MQSSVNLRNKFIPVLKKKKWSIEEFAEMCELTKAGVLGIFKKNDTKLSILVKMCEVAEITLFDLFESDENFVINEPINSYTKTADLYQQCLENNNHLTTLLRQVEEELDVLKKKVGKSGKH